MSLTGASGLHYAETAEDISRDLALDGAAYFRTDLIRQDVDMVTARINYRFGGPVVGRY
jgi:outer membrane immunogenic protein